MIQCVRSHKKVDYNSMSISFPRAAVAVLGVRFRLDAAGFTNKYPQFYFLQLYPIQGGVFLFASSAGFGLHGGKVDLERLSFPVNANGRSLGNNHRIWLCRAQVVESFAVHRSKVTIDEGLQNVVYHPPRVIDAVFL